MPLYALMHFLFPVPYRAKLLLAVWLGAAATVLTGSAAGGEIAALVVGAAGGGIVATVLVLGLLAPLDLVTRAFRTWGRTGRVVPLPDRFRDDIGVLMVQSNLLMARAQRSLDTSWTEADADPLTGALKVSGAESVLRDAGAGWLVGVEIVGLSGLADAMGDEAADEAQQHVAHICSQTIRQDDMLARIEEGRFLVFLPGASEAVASRIVARVDERLDLPGGGAAAPWACYAIAPYLGGGEVEHAFETIDAGLGAARSRGRDGLPSMGMAAA